MLLKLEPTIIGTIPSEFWMHHVMVISTDSSALAELQRTATFYSNDLAQSLRLGRQVACENLTRFLTLDGGLLKILWNGAYLRLE
jgi:DNA/RNA endonuclease G (NUC1)